MTGFRTLVSTETKLFLRERTTVILVLALPLGILGLFGLLPFSREASTELGGVRAIDSMLPSIAIGISITMLGLTSLPTYLATYREKGVLRRLSTTPAHPAMVLVAQLLINLCAALVSLSLVMAVGIVAFGVNVPRHPFGFIAVVALGTSALFALGLVVAAIAPSARVATGLGMVLFFPMMALGGVWVPRALMPAAMQRVSDFVPLGALLQSLQDTWTGAGPDALRLAVLGAVAVGATAIAVRTFRWE